MEKTSVAYVLAAVSSASFVRGTHSFMHCVVLSSMRTSVTTHDKPAKWNALCVKHTNQLDDYFNYSIWHIIWSYIS